MKTHETVASEFGRQLVAKNWEAAHSMLSADLRSKMSPSDLEEEVRDMIEYADDQITESLAVTEMEEWPDKEESDIGWVYIALSGNTFSEAVTVVVSNEGGNLVIRSLEWGRP